MSNPLTCLEFFLPDEAASQRFGQDLAQALRAGDCVCLRGEIGAGKSTIVRAAIQSLAGNGELDVPSPSYTLRQDYPLGERQVTHFDFYRLGDVDEVQELGLEGALEAGMVFVEWPENGPVLDAAIEIVIEENDEGRTARLRAHEAVLPRLQRSLAVRAFLQPLAPETAQRLFLSGDASTRRYERIFDDGYAPMVLMDSQPPAGGVDANSYASRARLAVNATPFSLITKALRAQGFSAPRIIGEALDDGLLLLEDLGGGSIVDAAGAPIVDRYKAAAQLLAAIHQTSWANRLEEDGRTLNIGAYDTSVMMTEVELMLDWYVPYATGKAVSPQARTEFVAAWQELLALLDDSEKSLVLRDYHSPNILWRENGTGLDRLGLIDYQDALIGPVAYDVASLALDARVDMSREDEQAIVDAYKGAHAITDSRFDRDYAIVAAQRNAKILGGFVRLYQRDGKPRYMPFLPRIGTYFLRALAHPALQPLKTWVERYDVPIPENENP